LEKKIEERDTELNELDEKIRDLEFRLNGYKKDNKTLEKELKDIRKLYKKKTITKAFSRLVRKKKKINFDLIRKFYLFKHQREKLTKLKNWFIKKKFTISKTSFDKIRNHAQRK